ncbi:MAG: hypothetical protein SFV23_21300, partial [Planctomycetaceae bacterium]|nr:hypothetical protein [Planctomycetaceae bacterium]
MLRSRFSRRFPRTRHFSAPICGNNGVNNLQPKPVEITGIGQAWRKQFEPNEKQQHTAMKYLFVLSLLLGARGLAAQAPPCDTTA